MVNANVERIAGGHKHVIEYNVNDYIMLMLIIRILTHSIKRKRVDKKSMMMAKDVVTEYKLREIIREILKEK